MSWREEERTWVHPLHAVGEAAGAVVVDADCAVGDEVVAAPAGVCYHCVCLYCRE